MIPRLLRAFLTMALVLMLTFAGARISGSPVDMVGGEGLSAADRAALAAEFGIDRPWPVQFVHYVASLARLDAGSSLVQRRPVVRIYAEALPTTLRLATAALAISLAAGLVLGVLATGSVGPTLARLADGLMFGAAATPHFLAGVLLVLVFSLALGWLPAIGQEGWKHFILPSVTLAAGLTATLARFLRQGLTEAMGADYVRTARAGGVAERVVVGRLALRNAVLPVLTVLGLHLGGMLAGSLVVENVFAMHGVGQVMIGAVKSRDYPVLQFGVLALALMVVVANMAVDLLYRWVDPRIGTGAT